MGSDAPVGGQAVWRGGDDPAWRRAVMAWVWVRDVANPTEAPQSLFVLVEQAGREAADRHDALVVHRRLPAGPGDQRGVDVGRLGPQRTHGALLTRTHAERVELEVLHGVEVRHLVDVLVRHAIEILHEQ